MNTDPVVEESPFKGQTGLRRIWNAFSYSLSGLHAAYLNEDAFRQESLLAALLIPTALLMPLPGLAKALMIASVTPASAGEHGPGERRTRSGLSARACSGVISSLRKTRCSTPNWPKYWTRLKVKES